jgi:hypothetical protein
MNKYLTASIVIFSMLLVTGCKKDVSSDYYLTMKIDNKPVSFSEFLIASQTYSYNSGSAHRGLVIEAYNKNSGKVYISLRGFSTGGYIDTDDSTSPNMVVLFRILIGVGYDGTIVRVQTFDIPKPASRSHPFNLIITKIAETYVEGTFDGVLVSGSTTQTISNGRFRVRYW